MTFPEVKEIKESKIEHKVDHQKVKGHSQGKASPAGISNHFTNDGIGIAEAEPNSKVKDGPLCMHGKPKKDEGISPTATRQDIAKAETDMEVREVDQPKIQKPPSVKLKYVPGPIGSLIDQAAVVGLQMRLNAKGELEFGREEREPIPLIGLNKKAWNDEVKKAHQ